MCLPLYFPRVGWGGGDDKQLRNASNLCYKSVGTRSRENGLRGLKGFHVIRELTRI